MPRNPPPSATSAQSALVLRRFRIVYSAVRSHFKQIEKQVGLGGAQVWALSLIDESVGSAPLASL